MVDDERTEGKKETEEEEKADREEQGEKVRHAQSDVIACTQKKAHVRLTYQANEKPISLRATRSNQNPIQAGTKHQAVIQSAESNERRTKSKKKSERGAERERERKTKKRGQRRDTSLSSVLDSKALSVAGVACVEV